MSGAFDEAAAEKLQTALKESIMTATTNGVTIAFDNCIKLAEERWQHLYVTLANQARLEEAAWFIVTIKEAKERFDQLLPIPTPDEPSTIPPPPGSDLSGQIQ